MKTIGVVINTPENERQFNINRDYLEAVERAGALPLMIPITADAAEQAAAIDAVDGLLLTGGADVDPASYGEQTQPFCGRIVPERDACEIVLCRLALAQDKPVLAVCRGHQIFNVALGGTLYQDIAAQYGTELTHPVNDRPAEPVHEVRTEEGSTLRRITGMATLRVNSRHHQAVKDLGKGLAVNARATDGLIEGIELPGKRFAVGVQWHPESLASCRPEAQAIFSAFVAAC